MSRRLILYHGGCRDGFAAAWALWQKYGNYEEYVPVNYGEEPPDVRDREVIIVDFSYPRERLLEMEKEAESLRVYDHHKSAQSDLADLDFAYFDMHRSGAGIAWDTFHATKRPWLINYVEDRDLWRHELPYSKEVNAFISTLEFDFQVWQGIDLAYRGINVPVTLGETVLAATRQYCIEVCKSTMHVINFEGMNVPCVNAPQVNISELLDYVKAHTGSDIAMGWFQRGSKDFQYSLRSNGDLDVSEIAKKYGGGGHKNAAGFQLPYMLLSLYNMECTEDGIY